MELGRYRRSDWFKQDSHVFRKNVNTKITFKISRHLSRFPFASLFFVSSLLRFEDSPNSDEWRPATYALSLSYSVDPVGCPAARYSSRMRTILQHPGPIEKISVQHGHARAFYMQSFPTEAPPPGFLSGFQCAVHTCHTDKTLVMWLTELYQNNQLIRLMVNHYWTDDRL